MKQELMKEAMKDIIAIEHDLYRELSEDEVKTVLTEGYEALFAKMGLSDEDYKTMRRIFALVSAGFTETDERYDEELAKNNYQAIEVLKALISDLEAAEAEKATTTKINLDLENKEDHGYEESEDPELNKYFTKEAQEEANESSTSYVPEHDEALNDIFENEDHFELLDCIKFFEALYGNKPVAEKSKFDRIIEGESVELTAEEYVELVAYLKEHYTNYAITNVNGLVTVAC